jgi:8-oxo-dGTP pyrophosphatase MutT (NUDIX family)
MSFTWDGLPVAPDPPTAVAIVVWRWGNQGREFLLLHRMAPGGPDYEGDWAWTPPAGARQPGEPPDAAAARELREETSLDLQITPLPEAAPSDNVALYLAQAPSDAAVGLDEEHDRFEWVSLEDALTRCLPAVVADGLASAAATIVERAREEDGRRSR